MTNARVEERGPSGLNLVFANRLLGFALLVLVGAIVLFLRNPDPILHPALFAEDATWVGPLLQGDAWAAYFYSRRDYLVLGQTMMLDLAVSLNLAVTGGTIAFLPQTLALFSYGFWSFYAALTFVALRPFLTRGWRLLAVALFLLLPLGAFANEVLGRIANLGYLFLPLSLTLVLLRESAANRGWSLLATCGLIVCLFTNPLCAMVIAGHLAVRFARRVGWHLRSGYVGDAALALALAIFAVTFVVRGGESTGSVPPGAVFSPESLVETLGARSLLYPFVFGVYGSLSDSIVLAIVVVLLVLVLWALYVSNAAQRLLGLALGACVVGTTLIVVAARPWLTDFMEGYGPTFPDRYFIAQNVFAVLLLMWTLSRLPRIARYTGGAILVAFVAFGMGDLFEFNRPRMVVVTDGGYADRVEQAAAIHADADPETLVLLDAYPDGFATLLPAGTVLRTAAAMSAPHNGTSPDLSRLDIGLLPVQLGAMGRTASEPMLPAIGAFPLEISVLNELIVEDDVLRASGGDPYILYRYAGPASDMSGASRLSFELICIGRTRSVPMQLFWSTTEHPGMSEVRSLSFTAHPGRIAVPLAVHPDFTTRETLDAIRLDINVPRACPGYRFKNVALERR